MKVVRMDKERTVFVVIDLQTRLMPVMSDSDQLERNAIKLIKGGRALGVDILVTQQYTRGIGPTTDAVSEALGQFEPIEKSTFSAMATEEFREALQATGKDTVVICGIESHICVEQTVLDLIEEGFNVAVAADCVSSRVKETCQTAINRMARAGAVITTHEAILYDLMKTSKADGFKAVSAIIK